MCFLWLATPVAADYGCPCSRVWSNCERSVPATAQGIAPRPWLTPSIDGGDEWALELLRNAGTSQYEPEVQACWGPSGVSQVIEASAAASNAKG